MKAAASWTVYLACSIFPIKKNKIVFSAFEGGGYGCNPKYIAEEIIRRSKLSGKNFELIWLVNDPTKKFPPEIKPVKNNLLNRAYHLSTAKIWVDNARKNFGTRKREGQFYMHTWHGVGVKPIGKMRGKSFSKIASIVSQYDASLQDCFLCDSKFAFDIFRKAFFNEPLIKIGAPRCDILVNDVEFQRKYIREKLNLPQDTKLLMYAPTFRGGSQSKVRNIFQEQSSLDFNLLKCSLEKKFGGNWRFLLRLHPQLGLRHNLFNISDNFKNFCIDITFEDDLYQFLAAVDVFLTDYSTASLEAAILKIPVFLFVDDYDSYIKERGNLILNISDYPFTFAKNNQQLQEIILNFDENLYFNKLNSFFSDGEFLIDGHASSRAVDLIENNL